MERRDLIGPDRRLLTVCGTAILIVGLLLATRLLWIANSSLAMDLAIDGGVVAVAPWDLTDAVGDLAGSQVDSLNGEKFSGAIPRLSAPFQIRFRTSEGSENDLEWSFARSLDRVRLDLGSAQISSSSGGRDGHRVLAIEGLEVASETDLKEAIETLRTSRPLLRVSRPDGTSYRLVLQQLDFWAQGAIFAAGAGFAILALVSLSALPTSKHARIFLVFCCCCACFLWLRSVPFSARSVVEKQLFVVFRVAVPATYFGVLAVFTPFFRSVGGKRLAWSVSVGMPMAFLLCAWLLAPMQAQHGLLGPRTSLLWFGTCLLLVLVTLTLPWLIRRSRSPLALDVQRARALAVAALLAASPVALDGLLRVASGKPVILGRLAVELLVLLFPVILAAALVRGQFLQTRDLMEQSGHYFLVGILLTGCFGVLIAAVVPLSRLFLPPDATGALFVLVGLVFFVFSPIHERLMRRLNERVSIDTTTLSLDQSTETLELPGAFCNRLVDNASTALGATVSILVRHPATDGWWLAARSRDVPKQLIETSIRPALDRLVRDPGLLSRDALAEDLSSSAEDDEVVQALDALGSSFAFPLSVGREVWGCLAVSQKDSLQNFTASDLKLLLEYSRDAARGLYQAYVRANPMAGPDLELRRDVGGYTLEEFLGQGAMSVVYRASRPNHADVALKITTQRVRNDPRLIERFEREALILSRIDSPRVMRILGSGTHEGVPFLAMELFESGTLRDLLALRRSLEVARAVTVALDVVEGLAAALQEGVVHRDVTPKNIFIRPDERAVIGDFGIAHLEDATVLTTHLQMMGTPGYLSPEICRGEDVTWAADQYALGVNLFEMLTGTRLFKGRLVMEIVAMHMHAPAPEVRMLRKEVPAELSEVVARMLRKQPADRFGSYAELSDALRPFSKGAA